MDQTNTKRKIMVIGHRNPDTDSICSAIAYSNLKNKTVGPWHEACRAGEINQETAFVLKRFGAKTPRRCLNVSAQVQDIDIRPVPGILGNTTMRRAWETMRDTQANSQPIVDEKGMLQGLITLGDLAVANMDSLDTHALSNARTPIKNVVEVLGGTVLAGDDSGYFEKGKIVIGASSPDVLENTMEAGDIVLVANRYETQLCAIEMGAACVVVCMEPTVAKTIVKLANERGCLLISSPYDTYAVSCLIKQSVPVSTHMTPREKLRTFLPSTPVDEVKKVMSKVRDNYFPVHTNSGKYLGLISRRNLLNLQRKQLILVDHNEKTQCVDGWEEADILEVVDHHRLGSLETSQPVFFRNQPVGCTCTIVYQMYQEQGVEIEPHIAGLMLSAILSDTLCFRSPTCTPVDEAAARELAKIVGVEPEELANEIFEAGENLEGRAAEDVFFQDFKIFTHGDIRFGVGQGSYMSEKNRQRAAELLRPYLPEALKREGVQMIFFMLTSVKDQSSKVLFCGEGAEQLIGTAFRCERDTDGSVVLPGVVSRKKQMIPSMLETLAQM